jgi:hypothetical protein
MREVTWEDKDGWKHRSLVRDSDPDTAAPEGIPKDPPDLRGLDWEGIMRDIHNRLVELDVCTWADWQRNQNALHSAVSSPLKRRIVMLLRQEEKSNE